jgi:hypothetical protein
VNYTTSIENYNFQTNTNIFVILEEVLANHNEHIAFAGDEGNREGSHGEGHQL